ncbi:helix-turn-helix transcriptional regulator [uncultured Acetobacterium sp.]|uniref:helix-turn-helix domain-containing protein n=1 Tax=uncultured Acetobacterium sp. TaxID=217139 RepID=UPI0025E1CEC3|nr:helix-turn-helix transcriptional regulator [uncultured Acetobacterium sp.]
MDNEDLLIFSQRVRQLRNELNLTQKDFAEKIGLTASALSAYENNTKNPSLIVAKKISENYHVSLDWLCGLPYEEKPTEMKLYSDLFQKLIDISEKVNCDIEFYSIDESGKSYNNSVSLKFWNVVVIEFAEAWKKAKVLLKDGTIDKNMYDDLMQGIIKRFDGTLPVYPILDDNPTFL